MKKQEKNEISMKWRMIGIMLMCWLLPFCLIIGVAGDYILSNRYGTVAQGVVDQVVYDGQICVERLNYGINASRKATYDQTLENRTVYDAVINGRSVCWGEVSAYLMLCRNAGLICEPVYAGNHAWTRTWIDGEWRYCDITWDKSLGGSTWNFLTQKDMDSDSMHNNL